MANEFDVRMENKILSLLQTTARIFSGSDEFNTRGQPIGKNMTFFFYIIVEHTIPYIAFRDQFPINEDFTPLDTFTIFNIHISFFEKKENCAFDKYKHELTSKVGRDTPPTVTFIVKLTEYRFIRAFSRISNKARRR